MTIKREGSAFYNISREKLLKSVLTTLQKDQSNKISNYRYEILRRSTDGFEIDIRIKPKLWPLVLRTNMKIIISGDNWESRIVLSYKSPWFVMGDALDIYNTYIRDFFQALHSLVESKRSYIPVKKKALQLDKEIKINWQTITVFVLIFLSFAVVKLRFYAFAKLESIHTVDHIATNGKSVCIHNDNNLHLLTSDGKLQQSIDLAELDLNSSPADIELLSDGSLLIGDSQTNTIWKCDIIEKNCHEIAPSRGIKINDNYKFLADEQNNTLYISDTNNHRLIAHDLKSDISTILKDVKLKYPNDLAINSEGVLHIADTKNTRVISVETVTESAGLKTKNQAYVINLDSYPEPKSTYKNVEAISEKVIAGAVSSYPSPLALVQAADKNWWVIVTDAYINYGELWIFNVLGDLINNISLSERSIPVDITRLRDNILVTDTEENQVYSLNTTATRIDPFGDEEFQAILQETKKKRDFYRAIKSHSFTMLGVLLIALISMLFVIRRKQNQTEQITELDGKK